MVEVKAKVKAKTRIKVRMLMQLKERVDTWVDTKVETAEMVAPMNKTTLTKQVMVTAEIVPRLRDTTGVRQMMETAQQVGQKARSQLNATTMVVDEHKVVKKTKKTVDSKHTTTIRPTQKNDVKVGCALVVKTGAKTGAHFKMRVDAQHKHRIGPKVMDSEMVMTQPKVNVGHKEVIHNEQKIERH